jgi:uncharacterized membrane protein
VHHAVTVLAYVLHVGAGMVGLASGAIALTARKGGYLHRGAGSVFIAAMVVVAIFAGYLAVVVPDQLVNLFIAAFTLYLLGTAWMTVHRKARTTGVPRAASLILSPVSAVGTACLLDDSRAVHRLVQAERRRAGSVAWLVTSSAIGPHHSIGGREMQSRIRLRKCRRMRTHARHPEPAPAARDALTASPGAGPHRGLHLLGNAVWSDRP